MSSQKDVACLCDNGAFTAGDLCQPKYDRRLGHLEVAGEYANAFPMQCVGSANGRRRRKNRGRDVVRRPLASNVVSVEPGEGTQRPFSEFVRNMKPNVMSARIDHDLPAATRASKVGWTSELGDERDRVRPKNAGCDSRCEFEVVLAETRTTAHLLGKKFQI